MTLGAFNWNAQKGGQEPVTQGLAGVGTQPISGSPYSVGAGVMASYPKALITVYLTGTLTLATIYSDNTVPTVLANPFSANVDGSFLFFAAIGVGYDVVISSSVTGGPVMPASVTLTDVTTGSSGGGGGSSVTIETNGVPNSSQAVLNFLNANGATWTNPSGGIVEVAFAAMVNLYEVVVYYPSRLISNAQEIFRLEVQHTLTFGTNFGGATWTPGGSSLIAPTGNAVYTVSKNGSSVGTITYGASSTAAPTFSASVVTFSPTDILTVNGPTPPDNTHSNFGFTLPATRTN